MAHDPGLSAVELRVEAKAVVAVLTFSRHDVGILREIDRDRDGRVLPAEFHAASVALRDLARDALEIRFDENRAPVEYAEADADAGDAVHFNLRFRMDDAARIFVRSLLLSRLSNGHRQYIAVRDGTGRLVGEKVLDAHADSVVLDLGEVRRAESGWACARRFVVMGVEHILTGYDHLAFLLALLLAGGSLLSAARTITSFTLAHSITLALAGLEVVRIPSSVVEPLIALSIVYVGTENLLRREIERRAQVAFCFGLIHGFGFATALSDMGLGSGGGGIVLPLLSFNLGVELGQLAVAATVLPVIWLLSRTSGFHLRFAPVCSALVTLAGSYWLLRRILPH